MERIRVNINVPKEVEVYEQKQLQLLRKSPFILDYLKEHHMVDQDLVENVPFFLQLIEEIQECRNCPGLHACVKKERGYVPVLRKIGFVQWVKTPCRYMKQRIADQELLQYYVVKQLPPEQRAVFFANVEVKKETKAYQKVFSEIATWGMAPHARGFYLHGAPGVGKSYLMLCLANQFANEKKTVAFINVLELVAIQKPRIDFAMLNEIVDADFVVLDDIGAETVNATSRDDILFAILDARMNRNKWTCFTSNFNMKELEVHFIKNQYGDEEPMKALRIMERIRALATEVEMVGKSRRF